MDEPLVIRSTDPLLSTLNFTPYHSIVERRVVPFFPTPNESSNIDIDTPWGDSLTGRKGDFLVSEAATPSDFWPIDPVIFEESYILIRPGYCVKKAVTLLIPLVEITHDPDQKVTIQTLEGSTTVRAGDFFLAKGVQGEIWPIPKEGIENVMLPEDLFQTYKIESNKAGTPVEPAPIYAKTEENINTRNWLLRLFRFFR